MIGRISTQNKHYNSKPVAPPSDFYISTMVQSTNLTYLSNISSTTFSTIDLQYYSSLQILNSNEILRYGNDIYITGNFGTSSYILKLKDCKLIKNRLFFQGYEENSITSFINYIHGMAYINDYIYLSSRAPGVTPVTIAKINSNNLQDISTLTLSVNGGTNDIIGYKNNLYVLAAPSSIGTASFVRISPDLATHSVVFVSGTSSSPSRRVRITSAFSIYNDEVYVPIANNVSGGNNQIGMQVFNLSGVLQRFIYNQSINSSASARPLPHWMAVYNNKLIISNSVVGTSSSHLSLVRMNITTLAVEESIQVNSAVTDDNSIFSDGYIYLNGEASSNNYIPGTWEINTATVSEPIPNLIKIKYNDFTDLTYITPPTWGYGSYGSINPIIEEPASIIVTTYTLDNSIISNPERGFYEFTDTGENGGYNLLSESTLTDYRTIENITVIQRQFFLKDFITGITISNTYLTNMQTDFNRIRNAGLKVIARFTYSSPVVAGLYQPTKAQILAHIDQLKPVVNANKDVIVSIQAGFIGQYGEWYYTGGTEGSDTDGSPEFGDKSNINATQSNNRKEVVDYMLSEFDVSIPLQVRTVPIKQTFYPSGNSRIGIYNDSFLNIWGDSGTFTADSAGATPSLTEIGIFQNASFNAPISGETNGTNSVTPSRTDGPNAKIELDFYNWSLINRDYFPEIIASWTASGDFDIIAKDLGYRFQLNSSTFTKTGTNMNVVINLTNIGYANSFKSRDAYIVFKNNSTSATYSYQITTDVNTWYSNVILNQTFSISSLASGTYSSYIWLPDNDPTLSTRPEYSIRFSNTGTWDSLTGYNNLNQSFTK